MTKTYEGSRTIDGIVVTVDGTPLDARYDIQRFTTMGFEWTYEGKEPRQLALAILAEHLNDDAKALKMSQHFMTSVIADLDNDWRLSGDEIDAALTGMG
ncbi:MAG: hypothetical protein HOB37_12110 [Rhodospirillaceae bacterium]|jgi:hypothetical protein|nr:hypothetical protein [Rhodospirillaceae bacterium]MBT3909856.1 hypothetical protein [Rhodospirillaceae bacterium]MBT5299716.1 hypothetical protein [Rhodospirillaceae bacterium]MBT5514696.1 hypothetical protein [Rhodospirillaceae bacterium]MBT6084130.1 hypothetical protein [Rhodospirillaceae bacterium]